MEKTIFIDKSYIVASILNAKIKQLKESYVTIEEVNYVSNEIQKVLNKQNLNVVITDSIDDEYFKVSNVIEINKSNGLSLESIIERYQGYLNLDILTLIWNENNIINYLKAYILEETVQVKASDSVKTSKASKYAEQLIKNIENGTLQRKTYLTSSEKHSRDLEELMQYKSQKYLGSLRCLLDTKTMKSIYITEENNEEQKEHTLIKRKQ